MRIRLALATAMTAAATLAVLPAGAVLPAAAGASARGRCLAHAYGSMKLTPTVVVYAGAPDADGATPVYACRKPGGASVLLGVDEPDDGEYGSDSVVGEITVAGRWVVAVLERGAASASMCSKVMAGDPQCPQASTVLRVVDTRTRRATELDAGPTSALALSTTGAIAWVSGGQLYGTALDPRGRFGLRAAPQRLDSGGAITKLHFERGRLLRWRSGGGARSARL